MDSSWLKGPSNITCTILTQSQLQGVKIPVKCIKCSTNRVELRHFCLLIRCHHWFRIASRREFFSVSEYLKLEETQVVGVRWVLGLILSWPPDFFWCNFPVKVDLGNLQISKWILATSKHDTSPPLSAPQKQKVELWNFDSNFRVAKCFFLPFRSPPEVIVEVVGPLLPGESSLQWLRHAMA